MIYIQILCQFGSIAVDFRLSDAAPLGDPAQDAVDR